ncbi:hypothetical protein [Deinococcus hopiensis]|uniref:DUF3887 domain-containing protein n=1 Tax=Deinococcus hopiensis KR-140 TaxID=695939 RepID=A0A1W1V9B2_9DEIO|nr:hypothetical protein [Deinococcus hopiensis]SMB90057.1 hypothetical protein SAMN00790413_00632 [Deinococcus hopiensis KR-140]
MNTFSRSVLLGLALLVPAAGLGAAGAQRILPMLSAPATDAEKAALTRGRALVADFYAVKVEGLWKSFTPELQGGWGSLGSLRAYREAGVQAYGAERQVLREWTFTDGGVAYYVRSARFEEDPNTLWNVVVGFDAAGRVSVFGIMEDDEEVSGPSA